ncbi:unnamed protein product [Cylicocyclus nassatus]|uniref:Helitron helicase-like domain-containing protein n=1 Tax=Cylicocyclus nassatus TaxID=53992 RepID=A0AA36DK23_CYLNA|nr:unnamed protein product [Cylicocyclus nassatus]
MMDEVLREEKAAASRENRSAEPVCMVFEMDRSLDRRRYNAPTSNGRPLFTSAKTSPDEEEGSRPSTLPHISTGYYFYLLQVRPGFNPIHHGGPLTQQFIVDAWVKTEQNRFNYIRTYQANSRADTYQSLLDFISTEDGSNGPAGKRIILPATIKGSPRSMLQDYQDAMTIVAKYGKPNFFITFTCNPKWREIEESLQPQIATDRPDIVARVHKCKFDALMDLLLTQHVLGRVVGYVSSNVRSEGCHTRTLFSSWTTNQNLAQQPTSIAHQCYPGLR